jgi:hypothetical protein
MILLNALFAAMMTAAMLVKPAQKNAKTEMLDAMKNRYLQTATVENVAGDEITVIDETGNVWAFYGDGMRAGDTVVLLMDNNGTPDDLSDDYIDDVLFCNDAECKND